MTTGEDHNEEFSKNVFTNIMGTFIAPEIERRKQKNLLPDDYTMRAAQVLIYPDGRPHLVRLNEEVVAEVKFKKGIATNAPDFAPSSADVEHIHIREESLQNCAHIIILLFKDGYRLSFDFGYNKKICNDHLGRAAEFIRTCNVALEENLLNAFIDNAYSAMELLAKANLLIEANEKVKGKITHKAITTAFNLRFQNAVSDFELARREVLNKLANARNKARYLEGTLKMEKEEMQFIYETIDTMYLELCNRAKL